MIATVVGGTGLTGSFLVRKLLSDPAITGVISVARRPLNVPDAKLTEVLVSDLAELPSIGPRIRGQLYFCCLGTTTGQAGSKANFERVDHDAVVAFAEVARATEATSFTLVSSMGASAGSPFLYTRVKGRTEDDVRAIGLRSLTIFRPAFLAGPRPESRRVERITTRTLIPLSRLLPARLRRRLVTEADALAARMAAEGKAAKAGVHVIEAKNI